ncbi:MAG TPA: DoxX family protein, partial [Bacteroidales bacterium]|nr:DoxX family protein [Bacteroidales bacterium]
MNYKRLSLTLLRFIVGWHFIYEGLSKLLANNWSAAGFLTSPNSFLSEFYHWLASPGNIEITNLLNMYGLLLIGLALFIGVLVRYAALAGFIMLMLYYLAYPPFGLSASMQPEGSAYIVNRQLIEAGIMLLFVFLKDSGYGIEKLRKKSTKKDEKLKINDDSVSSTSRREILKNLASLPLLGLMGWGAVLNNKKYDTDTLSGATIKVQES